MSDKAQKNAEKYLKILEKYGNDPNKVAEAYSELEERFGTQGQELGDLRKKTEESTKAVQQYADYVSKAKPVVEWYTANQDNIRQLYAQAQQTQRQPQQTQFTGQNSILTQDEQNALVATAAQYMQQNVLSPWSQNFAQQAQELLAKKLQEMNESFDKKQKAYGQVMWKTLEHAVPKESVEKLRLLHEEATKYADPSKVDPFKFAEESIETRAKLTEYETKLKEYEKEKEAREKAAIPSLGNSQGLFPRTDDEKKTAGPKDRDERFKAVMGTVQASHGNDGVEQLFGQPNPLR